MKKISIGTWAYSVGPYANNPIPFSDVVKGLRDMKFDGLELGAFGAHPTPENHPTLESRKALKDFVNSNDLEFSGIAGDMWSEKLVNAEDGGEKYLATVRKNLEFARDLGITLFRVDTVQPPEILNTMDKHQAMDTVVQTWRKVCKMAADMGILVTWEFEPGFVFNRPSDIVALVSAVGEKNFGAMFDTCHAYTCGVVGLRQTGGEKEVSADGVLSLAQKLRGKINAIQVIDCDGSLNEHQTSTHNPMGEGNIDFPPVMKELAAHSGSPHDWWTIDLCFWPNAWPATQKCKTAVDQLNALVSVGAVKTAAAAKTNGQAKAKSAKKAKAKPAKKAKAKAKPKAKAKGKPAKKKVKKGRK
jgi:sugar phosphate isomerase/epimerase